MNKLDWWAALARTEPIVFGDEVAFGYRIGFFMECNYTLGNTKIATVISDKKIVKVLYKNLLKVPPSRIVLVKDD